MVQANGIDLSLFHFDYDLTFAAFFMNADRTIYGRYGTRSSQQNPGRDISLQGLIASLEGTLKLHEAYPAGRESLLLKNGRKSRYPSPERYPSLRKFSANIDYPGQVARSCIHCHQIPTAEYQIYRSSGHSIPDAKLFAWPVPGLIGLQLSPGHRATVKNVRQSSPAHRGGLRAGDEIVTLAGQPILSTADIQWVLHNAGPHAHLKAIVRRGDKKVSLTLELVEGWRSKADISWRGSSWDLCRIVLGGMRLKAVPRTERREKDLPGMALLVTHLGQSGDHRAAKNSGLRKGDIVTGFDGRDDLLTESAVFAHGMQNTKSGERVTVKILRGEHPLEFKLPMK